MEIKDLRLFRRTRTLESEIDEYLDGISESAILLKHAVDIYLSDGASPEFEAKLHQVNDLESAADHLRRKIETDLYSQTLIPDSRGDVLGLLENLDRITNLIEGVLWGFSIERPDIEKPYRKGFMKLTEMVAEAAESVVLASRAFFRNIEAVGDHNHKVLFFEREADKVSTKLKRAVFRSNLDLAHKCHLRDFVESLDNIADWSEDVSDRLSIYAIKRTI